MVDDRMASARILIVDDEEDNVQVLRRILEAEGLGHAGTSRPPGGPLQGYSTDRRSRTRHRMPM
jgi:CheY-like chemotaxis protein